MERAIREQFPNRPISILRPPMVLGPRDRRHSRFSEWVGPVSVSNPDSAPRPIVSSRSMTRYAIFAALTASLFRGQLCCFAPFHYRLGVDRGGGGGVPGERSDRADPSSGCSNAVGFR